MMTQDQIREIAWIAWKGAANAFRMYPDNKHTFTDYWDGAKNQFDQFKTPAPPPAGEKMSPLLKKYTTYRDNIQWHIDTNKPEAAEKERLQDRVNDYSEIVADLRQALSQPPGNDEWVKVVDGAPEKRIRVIGWPDVGGYDMVHVDLDGIWKTDDGNQVKYPITHWRYLPTPPKQ